MKRIAKRYMASLIFSFDLLVLVLLSEVLRLMIVDLSSNYSMLNILVFNLLLFVLIPLTILFIWYVNPFATNKLLSTFGLTEELPEKEEKIPEKTKTEQPELTESEKLKREFQNRAI